MNERTTISGVILLTIVMVLTMFVAAPAGAHHKDGHDNGPSSSSDEDDSSNERGANSSGSDREGDDPDPEPTKTDPATKGPTECPEYNDSDGGPYDHDNCDGTQGQHGNGGNGKCAGCTGKADDKNPPGQYPGDHNNGYECDHNSGVGKGNPAHSKCPPPEKTTTSRSPSRRNRNSSRPKPAPAVNIPAPAVVNPGIVKVGSEVLGIRFNASPGRPPEQPAVNPAVLPFTGMPAGVFIVVGLALMTLGAVLMRKPWRSRSSSDLV